MQRVISLFSAKLEESLFLNRVLVSPGLGKLEGTLL